MLTKGSTNVLRAIRPLREQGRQEEDGIQVHYNIRRHNIVYTCVQSSIASPYVLIDESCTVQREKERGRRRREHFEESRVGGSSCTTNDCSDLRMPSLFSPFGRSFSIRVLWCPVRSIRQYCSLAVSI